MCSPLFHSSHPPSRSPPSRNCGHNLPREEKQLYICLVSTFRELTSSPCLHHHPVCDHLSRMTSLYPPPPLPPPPPLLPSSLSLFHQNENGPCPLLALCNVLILSGKMKIPPGETIVSSTFLLDLLGACILENDPEVLFIPYSGTYSPMCANSEMVSMNGQLDTCKHRIL